jgi:hypothetical protein
MYEAALTDYKAALQQAPSDSVLYSNVALVLLKLGRVNEVGGALQHNSWPM